ncbi:hypothetical protein DFJ43DRAFT_1149776 [Lentinula guzmanii]|uniref:Uncharacterized protein n=1 Tax=Lentinula guzmanii TaxID=2804957 RepID=A0AA38JVA2_9AGAR|nr:hypothetical protein DFJ43DRAFT_1149776 [Lentinula guzmanii]
MFASVRVLVLLCLSLLLKVAGVPAPTTEVIGALDGLSEDDIIDALDLGLVQNISVLITLESVLTNLMTRQRDNSIDFTAQNTLILEMTLDTMSCSAGVNNTVFASFSQTFDPPVVIPTLGTADSGPIDNVDMVQGILGTLSIIPLEELDILDMNITIRVASIGGVGGIPLALNGLMQSDVPTKYISSFVD